MKIINAFFTLSAVCAMTVSTYAVDYYISTTQTIYSDWNSTTWSPDKQYVYYYKTPGDESTKTWGTVDGATPLPTDSLHIEYANQNGFYVGSNNIELNVFDFKASEKLSNTMIYFSYGPDQSSTINKIAGYDIDGNLARNLGVVVCANRGSTTQSLSIKDGYLQFFRVGNGGNAYSHAYLHDSNIDASTITLQFSKADAYSHLTIGKNAFIKGTNFTYDNFYTGVYSEITLMEGGELSLEKFTFDKKNVTSMLFHSNGILSNADASKQLVIGADSMPEFSTFTYLLDNSVDEKGYSSNIFKVKGAGIKIAQSVELSNNGLYDGGFTVKGGGTLDVAADASGLTGVVAVTENSTLKVSGARKLGAGKIIVDSGSKLLGDGTIAVVDQIQLDGRLGLYNTTGELLITGNIALTSTSEIAIRLYSENNFDIIALEGNFIGSIFGKFILDVSNFQGLSNQTIFNLNEIIQSTSSIDWSKFDFQTEGGEYSVLYNGDGTITVSAIPEPSTIAALLSSIVLIAVIIRKRK